MSATAAMKALAILHADVAAAVAKAAKSGIDQADIAAALAKLAEICENADDIDGE